MNLEKEETKMRFNGSQRLSKQRLLKRPDELGERAVEGREAGQRDRIWSRGIPHFKGSNTVGNYHMKRIGYTNMRELRATVVYM